MGSTTSSPQETVQVPREQWEKVQEILKGQEAPTVFAPQEDVVKMSAKILDARKELLEAAVAPSEFTAKDIKSIINEARKTVNGTVGHNVDVKEALEGSGLSELNIAVEILKSLQTQFIEKMASHMSDDTLNRVSTEADQFYFGVQQYYIHFKNFSTGEGGTSEFLRAEKTMLQQRLCSLIHFLATQDPSIEETEAYKWSQAAICGPLRASQAVEKGLEKADQAIESYGQILRRRFVRAKRKVTEWITDIWKERRESTFVKWSLWLWKHRVTLIFIGVFTLKFSWNVYEGHFQGDWIHNIVMLAFTLCETLTDPLFVWKTASYLAGKLANWWVYTHTGGASGPTGISKVVDGVVNSSTNHLGPLLCQKAGTWLLSVLMGLACTVGWALGESFVYFKMLRDKGISDAFRDTINWAIEKNIKSKDEILADISTARQSLSSSFQQIGDSLYERFVASVDREKFASGLETAMPGVAFMFKLFPSAREWISPPPVVEIGYLQPWVYSSLQQLKQMGHSLLSSGPVIVDGVISSLRWILQLATDGWNSLTYILTSLYHFGLFLKDMYLIGQIHGVSVPDEMRGARDREIESGYREEVPETLIREEEEVNEVPVSDILAKKRKQRFNTLYNKKKKNLAQT